MHFDIRRYEKYNENMQIPLLNNIFNVHVMKQCYRQKCIISIPSIFIGIIISFSVCKQNNIRIQLLVVRKRIVRLFVR